MASTASSNSTVPTASSKKMRVRSKSTSAVTDEGMKADVNGVKQDEIKQVQYFKRPSVNGNMKKNEADLFVKAPKDKLHDRKSRSGKGRGLPKKGGAGGKGTWGVIGEVIEESDLAVKDQQDPNYESEEDENEPYKLLELKPELTGEEFDRVVEPIIEEYYEHGDTEDVALSLLELNIPSQKYKIPVKAIGMAMEKKATQREMASVLISDIYGEILTQDHISKSFQQLLDDLDDLSLDTPDAPEVLGKFIARAIADDCLPPCFVKNVEDTRPESAQRKALHKADILLHVNHSMVRLDSIWGVGGGRRPVKHLIKKMVLLLKEYLSSQDTEEASRCVQELEVPHFHHELVYELIYLVLEDANHNRTMNLMLTLLKSFSHTSIITSTQIKEGFERVFKNMADISLDVPLAHFTLQKFTDQCVREGILPISYTLKVPSKGRKRMVSEGDGGLIKA